MSIWVDAGWECEGEAVLSRFAWDCRELKKKHNPCIVNRLHISYGSRCGCG